MTFSKTWQLLVGCLALMVAMVGCYQGTGDSAAPTAVASSIPPTLTPTSTPSPTLTPEAEGSATIGVDAESALFDTITPEASDSVDLVAEPLTTSVAQSDTTDGWQLSATAIVAEITQTHEYSLTQTAIAAGFGEPTLAPLTPTPTGAPVGVTPVPGGSCVHQVVAGDNLFRLSIRYGVTIDQIAAANGISNIQLITVNQRLTIPGCGTTGNVPPPTTSAGLNTQNPGGVVTNPGTGTSTCAGTYVVQQYDTLFQISLQCGVPMQSIANANGIANPSIIIIGDQLVIPSS